MIGNYTKNSPMRAKYLELNGITHTEIWKEDGGYSLALCSGDRVGFVEYHHKRKGEVLRYLDEHLSDIPHKGITVWH